MSAASAASISDEESCKVDQNVVQLREVEEALAVIEQQLAEENLSEDRRLVIEWDRWFLQGLIE